MRAILTNETAQRIIDFVSPVYGNSYVGLWLFQALGIAVGEACDIAERLKLETNPATANLLLDYWEDHYGIPRNSSMTVEERQNRILLNMRLKGPSNPAVMASQISSALGVPVEITENVRKNTFLVTIKGSVSDVSPAITIVEQSKPAHLLYQIEIQDDVTVDLDIASAITHAENHAVEVNCEFYETVEANPRFASAVTHSEHYTMEVLN